MIVILVAIALFVALNLSVSQMMRGGTAETISQTRARLFAGELIDYGRLLAQAVQQISISEDCVDTEISLTVTSGDSYEHTPPVRDECKVFNPNGGSMVYQPLPPDVANVYPDWLFHGNREVDEVGTTCAGAACSELMLFALDIPLSVCIEINDTLGITNPSGVPPVETVMAPTTSFIGTYTYVRTMGLELAAANLSSELAGCLQVSASGDYLFYQVLLPR